MHDEAIYHIRIAGRLGAEWSERLGGMTLVVHEDSSGASATTLTGPVADQAALMGVLFQCYELGATLLVVERREMDEQEDTWLSG